MKLWSKGLGRLVLDLRLAERTETVAQEDRVELRGTMGKPVYWSYAVRMQQDDMLDLLGLLKQPAAVSFMVGSEGRGTLLRSALAGGLHFAWGIASRVLTRQGVRQR
jgi:hypothetical protein